MNHGPRKNIRLSGYDYSRAGAYFVTICTTERAPIFWKDFLCPELSPSGMIASKEVRALEERFLPVRIEKYVIMPDHVHILLTLRRQGLCPCLIPLALPLPFPPTLPMPFPSLPNLPDALVASPGICLPRNDILSPDGDRQG